MAYDLTTSRGTAAYVTGKDGQALSGGYLAISAAINEAVSGVTFEAWVKTTATSLRVAVQLKSAWLGVNASGKATAGLQVGGGQLASTVTINDGLWHHVAFANDGTNTTLWVDGGSPVSAADTGFTTTLNTTTPQFAIGGIVNPATFDWLAADAVDLVRVSRTVRYTSAFTPPAVMVDDAPTIALYQLNGSVADAHGLGGAILAATDANIVYSPGNWGVSGPNMKTINAGAYLRTRVTAAGATAFVFGFSIGNDLTPLPQIELRVDGGPWQSQEIAATISIPVPTSNVWASHILELRVKSMTETQARWSTTATEVVFTGITVTGASNALTTALKQRPLRGLYLGDSITEGVRTLAGTTVTKDTDRNSASQGWAHMVAEQLGAEAGIVGFGGSGLTVTGSGSVPVVGTTYTQLWGSGPTRDLSVFDYVLINEGTNDSAATSSAFTAAYTALLNGLLAATSSTCTIIAMRPFNGTHDADIQAATLACSNPLRVAYLDTTGLFTTTDSFDGLHPYGLANSGTIAPLVTAAVRAILKVQTTMLLNLGGAVVPAAAFTQ